MTEWPAHSTDNLLHDLCLTWSALCTILLQFLHSGLMLPISPTFHAVEATLDRGVHPVIFVTSLTVVPPAHCGRPVIVLQSVASLTHQHTRPVLSIFKTSFCRSCRHSSGKSQLESSPCTSPTCLASPAHCRSSTLFCMLGIISRRNLYIPASTPCGSTSTGTPFGVARTFLRPGVVQNSPAMKAVTGIRGTSP